MRRCRAVRYGDASVGPRQRRQSMPLRTIEPSLSRISEARCVMPVLDCVTAPRLHFFGLRSIMRRSPNAGPILSWAPIPRHFRTPVVLMDYRYYRLPCACQGDYQELHPRPAGFVKPHQRRTRATQGRGSSEARPRLLIPDDHHGP